MKKERNGDIDRVFIEKDTEGIETEIENVKEKEAVNYMN